MALPAKICTSIAAESPQLMKEMALDAFSKGSDFVEIRFDFLKPDDMAAGIASASEFKGKAVFTVRSSTQGGKFAGSELERISWLRRMASENPMLVDVELETLRENDDLADFLENQRTAVLVSWHDFKSTPSANELADLLSEMRVYSNYVKIVATAKHTDDALRLLDLYEGTLGLNAIIFAMGAEGIISRVLCTIVGNAPFTYASLDNAVAPGQLTVNTMRKLYDKMNRRGE
jgi:3-dehydroquinate dehydratase-1